MAIIDVEGIDEGNERLMNLKPTMNFYLEDRSIREWIDYTVESGFEYMELVAVKLPEDAAQRDEIIQYGKEKGLGMSIHAPFGRNNIIDTDEENRQKSIAMLKDTIDLAAKHNFISVTFHPGRLSAEDESEEEKWEQLIKTVGEIAEYAKEKKVHIGIENMEKRPFELVYTIDDLNRFAELGRDNPYFGVTLDFAHFSSHGITKPDLSKLKLPVHNVHLSQGVNGKLHRELTVGEGMVDVKSVCEVLNSYGYKSLVVFEVPCDQAGCKRILEECELELSRHEPAGM